MLNEGVRSAQFLNLTSEPPKVFQFVIFFVSRNKFNSLEVECTVKETKNYLTAMTINDLGEVVRFEIASKTRNGQ